jgi:hypothetical protein
MGTRTLYCGVTAARFAVCLTAHRPLHPSHSIRDAALLLIPVFVQFGLLFRKTFRTRDTSRVGQLWR